MQQLSTYASQRCPDCDAGLSADDINIKEGFALCPSCGSLSRLSQLRLSGRSFDDILARPPPGCTIESDGQSVRVKASLRSILGFIATAAFALFWNGITSLFVSVALAGLYANLIGPIPDWFPAIGVKNGKPEMNDEPMGLGATLGLCLFLVPFVTVGLCMAVAALLQLFGRVEVVVDELGSYVATGFRFIRWKRRFNGREVTAVKQRQSSWKQDDEHQQQIELVADRTIKFGSMLTEERHEWMYAALHELFLGDGSRSGADFPALPWLKPRR